MVSRFPNGSPVDLRNGEHVIATFNKPFTREDLIGKLVAVVDGVAPSFYYDANPKTLGVYEEYQSGAPDEILLTDADDATELELLIRGNNLVADTEDFLMFTIDYDGQHKKVWDINDAGYLLEMPNLILPGSETTRYNEVSTYNDPDDGLYFTLRVNNEDEQEGYQPITNTAELDDSDVDSWYNDHSGVANMNGITSLINQILLVEYNFNPEKLIVTAADQTFSVDGGMLNLFTDGSPYVPVEPLQMTSRFPSGSPILGSDFEGSEALLCTFNRNPTEQELLVKLDVVLQSGSDVEHVHLTHTDALGFASSGAGGTVEIEIRGNQVYLVDNNGIVANIWSVDYNGQHKRAFAKTDGTYQLIMPVTCSEIDNVKMYPFVKAAVTANELDLQIIVNNSKVVVNDIELSEQSEGTIIDGISLETLKSILFELIHLEYNKSSYDVDTYSDEDPIIPDGTLNLLTD